MYSGIYLPIVIVYNYVGFLTELYICIYNNIADVCIITGACLQCNKITYSHLLYKIKFGTDFIWWFGELQKSAKLNTAKFSFLLPNACKIQAFANIKSANYSEKVDSPN